MKSLAVFLTICVLFSLTNSKELSDAMASNKSFCFDSCKVCQETIYSLKFERKSNCENLQCKSTCFKVLEQWNQPGSPFSQFQSEQIGKCDACTQAGHCTPQLCKNQKNYEANVINKVIDNATLKGAVNKPSVKSLVQKIISNKQVNFREIEKKVLKKTNKIDKNISLKKISKLKDIANNVANTKASDNFNYNIRISKEKIRKFSNDNKVAKKVINNMVNKINDMAEELKKHSSKKMLEIKKATLNKVYNSFQQSILESAEKLHFQTEILEEVRHKIATHNGSDSARGTRNVDRLLKEILTFLNELQKASEKVENVFIKLNK